MLVLVVSAKYMGEPEFRKTANFISKKGRKKAVPILIDIYKNQNLRIIYILPGFQKHKIYNCYYLTFKNMQEQII